MLSPMKAIRAECLSCCKGSFREVELCPAKNCPLQLYRMGKMRAIKNARPLRAIRKKCLDCMGQERKMVENCPFNSVKNPQCTLYPYRFGHKIRKVYPKSKLKILSPSGDRVSGYDEKL